MKTHKERVYALNKRFGLPIIDDVGACFRRMDTVRQGKLFQKVKDYFSSSKDFKVTILNGKK